MDTTAINVFTKAAGYVEHGWCQGHYAEDELHNEISWSDPDAVNFCLMGALIRAKVDLGVQYPHPGFSTCEDFLSEVAEAGNLSTWNDIPGRTKEEVLELLHTAIQRVGVID